jgi:succinoglycan biosynthesis transport protein ExoP
MSEPVDFYEEPGALSDSPKGEVHLSEYFAILLKRRRLILQCVGVAVVVALVVAVLSTSEYEAAAVLNVEREKGSLLDVAAIEQAGGFDPEYLPTQMRLMRSREISERVAQKLNLAADPVFTPRKGGVVGKADSDSDSAHAALSRAAARVKASITASPIRGTNLVELACVAPSPELAARIANAVAETYIEWSLEAKFRIVNQASQFLTAQAEQLKSELDEKEKELLAYGREKDIVSVDPRTNVTLQKLETLNRDYAGAVAERVAKEARDYEARNASPETLANAASSGLVAQLKNDVSRLERDYAEKLNLFKPEWPAMQQLKIQIDKERQHLASVVEETVTKAREAARSEYTTALRREGSLREVLQTQKTEAMNLNTNAVEYNNLRIEVETKRALLDSILRKQAETEIMSRLKGERVSNIRVVDKALPPGGRSSPSYRRNLLLGLLGGGALGVGLAFFLSYLDRSLYTTEQVEQLIGLPALGVIPASRSLSRLETRGLRRAIKEEPAAGDDAIIELLPHRDPRSQVAESYRSFRTALLLSRAGGLRSVVVTSCFPGEGKSSTAVNLAIVLTQLGKRVLLVDADLHRPRLHEVFRVSNKLGLVSILAEGAEPSLAILKTGVSGVFLVPAGPTSPNPSGLLSSEGMTKFLELAQMNFDYVIVDTPPVFPVSDVLVFAQQTDGVVLCVQAGKTPREDVIRARDRIQRSRALPLGVLLNNLDLSAAGYPYAKDYRFSYYGEKPAPEKAGPEKSAAEKPAVAEEPVRAQTS